MYAEAVPALKERERERERVLVVLPVTRERACMLGLRRRWWGATHGQALWPGAHGSGMCTDRGAAFVRRAWQRRQATAKRSSMPC